MPTSPRGGRTVRTSSPPTPPQARSPWPRRRSQPPPMCEFFFASLSPLELVRVDSPAELLFERYRWSIVYATWLSYRIDPAFRCHTLDKLLKDEQKNHR